MNLSEASFFNLRENYSVRLACVKHAASVYPEPGSNSQIKFVFLSKLPWSFKNVSFTIPKFTVLIWIRSIPNIHYLKEFSGLSSLFCC